MRRRWIVALILLCAAVAVWALRGRILWALGAALVHAESPVKADIILVLGGGLDGSRVLKAVELVKAGYAPKILISGPVMIFGTRESALAARYAIAEGLAPDQVIPIVRHDFSTADEARDLVPVLRQMGVHRYLLVTNPSHTGRATRVFQRLGPDLEVHPVAAPDPEWCNGYWWTGRECRKTWLLEATKNITDLFGL